MTTRKMFACAFACTYFVATAAAGDVETKVIQGGLNNPCGVTVQPGTGAIFVSDSGAGRIIKCDAKSPNQAVPVVTDFALDIYGKGPMYKIGPLGLLFLDRNTLVVGGGDQKDGSEMVYFYDLAKGGVLKADAPHAKFGKFGPIGPGAASKLGEGNFYALAADSKGIYITANGDDTKGWVLKIPMEGKTPKGLKPFIATKEAVEVDAPVGITMSPNGDIVVGQMGEITVPGDSLLTFYNTEGKLISKAKTGLHDIAGLAYSPKSGRLYAVDFAWNDTTKGGLFRLDVTGNSASPTVRAVKIASVDKPTALAFSPDGKLYVTAIGSPSKDNEKGGQLIEFSGDL